MQPQASLMQGRMTSCCCHLHHNHPSLFWRTWPEGEQERRQEGEQERRQEDFFLPSSFQEGEQERRQEEGLRVGGLGTPLATSVCLLFCLCKRPQLPC
jgi:hypothetical protein